MPNETKTTENKAPKTRSPNYPALPLMASIAKANTLLTQFRRHPVGLESIAKAWNVSAKSSTFKLWLAALRAFGLLENVSGGSDRMVKLTGLALDILADYPRGSPEQSDAIKRAALSPALHAELRERYGPELPSDDEVKRYLVRERGFNERSVFDFITEYKETIAYAKLGEAGTIHRVAVGERPFPGDPVQWNADGQVRSGQVERVEDDMVFVEGNPTGIPMSETTISMSPPKRPDPRPTTSGVPPLRGESTHGPHISFPLTATNTVEIRLTERLSPEAFKRLKQLIDLSESALVVEGSSGGSERTVI